MATKWNLMFVTLLLSTWLLVGSPALSAEAAGGRTLSQTPAPGDCLFCTWTCAESVTLENGDGCCIRCNPYPDGSPSSP